MRRKTTTLQRIDKILGRALQKRHVPFRPDDRRLVEMWEKAVGPRTACQSRPDFMRRGTLHVRVVSPVWMQQLRFLKEEIAAKIRELTGNDDLKDIRFSIGQVPAQAQGESQPSAPPPSRRQLSERDEKMIADCLVALPDEELRMTIERVMVKEITRRRSREKKGP